MGVMGQDSSIPHDHATLIQQNPLTISVDSAAGPKAGNGSAISDVLHRANRNHKYLCRLRLCVLLRVNQANPSLQAREKPGENSLNAVDIHNEGEFSQLG